MVGEYIFKGHNLVFDFCPSFLQSWIPISFECLWETSLLDGVTLSLSFYPKIRWRGKANSNSGEQKFHFFNLS